MFAYVIRTKILAVDTTSAPRLIIAKEIAVTGYEIEPAISFNFSRPFITFFEPSRHVRGQVPTSDLRPPTPDLDPCRHSLLTPVTCPPRTVMLASDWMMRPLTW